MEGPDRALWGARGLDSQAVTGYIRTVRQTFFIDDLTVLVSQSCLNWGASWMLQSFFPDCRPMFYWEKQGVGVKWGNMQAYLVQVFTQCIGTKAE